MGKSLIFFYENFVLNVSLFVFVDLGSFFKTHVVDALGSGNVC